MKYRSTAGKKIKWTDEDINFIKENFDQLTNPELATHLRLRLTSVRTKCHELGLKRMEMEYWTPEQIKFLKSNYKKIGGKELAEIFDIHYYKAKGWTLKHIEKKRMYLGLKRTPKQLQKIKERNRKNGCWAVSHYKRWLGRITPAGTVKTWRNQYGKPVKVIKTELGFVHYAPYLWMQHNGDIPEGYVIGFKDKNNMNVVIENLICITRQEHAIRHHYIGYDELPEELQTTVLLISKINKKIKNEKQIKRLKQSSI